MSNKYKLHQEEVLVNNYVLAKTLEEAITRKQKEATTQEDLDALANVTISTSLLYSLAVCYIELYDHAYDNAFVRKDIKHVISNTIH